MLTSLSVALFLSWDPLGSVEDVFHWITGKARRAESVPLVNLNGMGGEGLGALAVTAWLGGGPAGATASLFFQNLVPSTRPCSPFTVGWYPFVGS